MAYRTEEGHSRWIHAESVSSYSSGRLRCAMRSPVIPITISVAKSPENASLLYLRPRTPFTLNGPQTGIALPLTSATRNRGRVHMVSRACHFIYAIDWSSLLHSSVTNVGVSTNVLEAVDISLLTPLSMVATVLLFASRAAISVPLRLKPRGRCLRGFLSSSPRCYNKAFVSTSHFRPPKKPLIQA